MVAVKGRRRSDAPAAPSYTRNDVEALSAKNHGQRGNRLADVVQAEQLIAQPGHTSCPVGALPIPDVGVSGGDHRDHDGNHEYGDDEIGVVQGLKRHGHKKGGCGARRPGRSKSPRQMNIAAGDRVPEASFAAATFAAPHSDRHFGACRRGAIGARPGAAVGRDRRPADGGRQQRWWLTAGPIARKQPPL